MASTESLETVLADSQQRIEGALRSSKRVASILSSALKASKQGDMAALRRSRKEAVEALRVAQVDVANVAAAWPWDEETESEYFRIGTFVQELVASARSAGLDLFEEEGQVLCYPSLVRVDPGRRLVLIDKRPHRSVRPSALVAHLKEMQKRPPRLKVDAFLESLFTAWEYARHYHAGPKGPPQGVRVDKIYAALTIAPGSSKEYTKQEFGRDLYVLEASDVRTTRKGARISFSRATGTKASSGVISVVGKDGRTVLYSSIEFTENR